MRTGYITHPDCRAHDTSAGHPESARRLSAIEDALVAADLFDYLRYIEAPEVADEQLLRVHDREHLERVAAGIPVQGYAHLDPDTVVSPDSLGAARRAAGAVVRAVDLVMGGELDNAFCSVRPPGHHAERSRAMGFCLFNNIAVGAAHAMAVHGLERIAIVDFDVHQGNGTEQIFEHDRRVLFCSTFQHPFYPHTPIVNNAHMLSVPLAATARSEEFREAVSEHWLPALSHFRPQMLFVSAGFDAHRDDDMSGVSLTDNDYGWVTEQLRAVAADSAAGRIISVLEGGYEIHALGRSVVKHLRVLMGWSD